MCLHLSSSEGSWRYLPRCVFHCKRLKLSEMGPSIGMQKTPKGKCWGLHAQLYICMSVCASSMPLLTCLSVVFHGIRERSCAVTNTMCISGNAGLLNAAPGEKTSIQFSFLPKRTVKRNHQHAGGSSHMCRENHTLWSLGSFSKVPSTSMGWVLQGSCVCMLCAHLCALHTSDC